MGLRSGSKKQQRGILRTLSDGDTSTTPGEEETGVVSETVPSPPVWHVWEYSPETNRTVYLGAEARRRDTGEHTYYLTQEQHQAILDGDDVHVELAKDK